MELGKDILKRFLFNRKKSRSKKESFKMGFSKKHILKQHNKKGGVIFLIDLLAICIFPIIMVQIIDTSNVYYIDKHLKSTLDLATKSASLYENASASPGVPDGKFYIDTTKANSNFIRIFNLNYHSVVPTNTNPNARPAIVDLQKGIFIYNGFPAGNTPYPTTGTMSKITLGYDLLGRYPEFQIQVKRPTALGVARIKYRTFYGKEIDILKYSSSQMSNKND